MTTETITEPETKPKLDDGAPLDQWPPVAHLIYAKDRPAREGTIAMCGAKLMGLDLGLLGRDGARFKVCAKCEEIARKELGL